MYVTVVSPVNPRRSRETHVAFRLRQKHGQGDDRYERGERGQSAQPAQAHRPAARQGSGAVIGPRGVAVGAVAVVALIVAVRGVHRPPSAKVAGPAWPAIEAEDAPPTPTAATTVTTMSPTAAAAAGSGGAGEAEGHAAELEAGGEEEALAPPDQWRALLATDAPRAGLYRLIGDPASSDLPPAVSARAASTGSRFLVADVTGVGRETFPDWWGERPAVPVAATARVLAAGAAAYGPLVQVVVVWDGTAPDGSVLGERTSTVVLDSTSSDVFVPVHPGDVG